MNPSVKSILVHTLKKQKIMTVSIVISVFFVVLLSLIPPQILKIIVDQYLTGNRKRSLLYIGCLYLIILIAIGIFDVMKEGILTLFGQRVSRNIRSEMMKKTANITSGYFIKNEPGILVSRFTNDVEAIQALFTNGVVSMAIDILKIIGITVSIWIFSAKLGMIVLAIIPVIYGITRLFQKKMLSAQIENRKWIAKVNNHIPETIKNLWMIRSFHKEVYMEEKYEDYLMNNFSSMERVNFYDSVFSPIILMIRALIIAAMVILCADEISLLGISVGMVAAAIDLISNIFYPIESLGMEFQSIQSAAAGVKRVNSYLKKEEHLQKSVNFDYHTFMENGVSIVFKEVDFAYQEEQSLLKKVSFSIYGNEKVTFMGRTGAGKSTLFKLILGLLETDGGEILINGVNAASIPNHEKRNIFGYVEQSFHFVQGNIADQITLRDEKVTREAAKEAMNFVGLHTYVEQLPQKYDTPISEYLFSQGQRQLLSIARAIVTNPPILLLDEITANLDSETEQKMISVLLSAGEGRMLLSISHRLSAVLKDNRVLSLDEGNIS